MSLPVGMIRKAPACTAAAPIVFTANFPEGMRGVGNNNWGGLLLNGKAAINVTGGDNKAEGLADEPRNRYGGGATPDDAHSCGKLRYVRVEFAGQPLSANDELNGLTLNACGTGTIVDYVQVHRGIDDGVERGTVAGFNFPANGADPCHRDIFVPPWKKKIVPRPAPPQRQLATGCGHGIPPCGAAMGRWQREALTEGQCRHRRGPSTTA